MLGQLPTVSRAVRAVASLPASGGEGAPPSTVSVMSSQFGATFPAGTPGDMVVAVHPTQLYEVVLGFVMFAVLWRLRKHTNKAGWLFGVWCVLAGVERFIIEFFRAKDDQTDAGLTTAQIIALTVLTIGIALIASRRKSAQTA